MTLVLQPLDAGHLERLVEVERACYSLPWSRTMFTAELARPDGVRIGAFDGDDVIGYLLAAPIAGPWHVMNVAVHPAHRRRGIASALLSALLERTVDRDTDGYTLEVRVSNAPAIELYRSYGFRGHGIRPGYYLDTREDALVMWRPPQSLLPAGHSAPAELEAAAAWRPAP